MTISFINEASSFSSNSNPNPVVLTQIPSKPTNTAQGDIMMAIIWTKVTSLATPPSGWTLVNSANVSPSRWGGLGWATYIYQKRAGSGEPSTYSWSSNENGPASSVYPQMGVEILTFRGADAATQVQTSGTDTGEEGSSDPDITVVPRRSGALLWGCTHSDSAGGSNSLGNPSGMTTSILTSVWGNGSDNALSLVGSAYLLNVQSGSVQKVGSVSGINSDGFAAVMASIADPILIVSD